MNELSEWMESCRLNSMKDFAEVLFDNYGTIPEKIEIKREKQVVWDRTEYNEYEEELTIDQVLAIIDKFKKDGYTGFVIRAEGEYDSTNGHVIIEASKQRLETDKELNDRIAREEKNNRQHDEFVAKKEQARRAHYEQLKKEFEGK